MIARLTRHLLATHAAFVLGPIFGLTSILAFRSTEDLFFDLDEEHLAFIQFGWFAIGFILGLVLLLHEQTPPNREIALQRGTSASGLYWSRVIAGLVLTIVIGLGALLVGTAIHLVGPNGGLVTVAGLLHLGVVALSAFAGFCLGAWLTTLRGSPWTVGHVAVLVVGAVVLGEFLLVLPSASDPAPGVGRYVGAQLLFAALALAFGSRGYLLANDRDRPVPLAAQLGRALGIASALGLLFVAVLPELQKLVARELRAPTVIGRAKDGSYVVGERTGPSSILPTDPNAAARGMPVEVEDTLHWLGYSSTWNARPPEREAADGTPIAFARNDLRLGAMTYALLFHPTERLVLDAASGQLRFARLAQPRSDLGAAPGRGAEQVELTRPDGRRFGPRPTVVGGSRVLGWTDYDAKKGPPLLGDLDDGTLWRVHLRDGTPRVEPVPLPGGDRFAGWGWSHDVVRERGPAALHDLAGQIDAVVVRGERGRYAFDPAGSLVPTESQFHPWERTRDDYVRAVDSEDDPFLSRIEIDARRGSPAFSYEYVPRTLREKLPGFLCSTLSLYRPPIALDATFEGLGHGPASRAVCRPVAALALALVLALLVARALARRGAERARIAAWCALVLLLGVPAGIAFLLLERRAAFAPMPVALAPDVKRITVLEALAPNR